MIRGLLLVGLAAPWSGEEPLYFAAPGGPQLYVMQDARLPIVCALVWFPFGPADELPEERGMSAATAAMLEQRGEGLAPLRRAQVLPDAIGMEWLFPAGEWRTRLQALWNVDIGAAAPEGRAAPSSTGPDWLDESTWNAAIRELFGEHPYAWALSSEGVAAATRRFDHSRFGRRCGIWFIFGDVPPEDVQRLFATTDWGPPQAAPAARQRASLPPAGERIALDHQTNAWCVMWLTPAPYLLGEPAVSALVHRLTNPIDGLLTAKLAPMGLEARAWRGAWRDAGIVALGIAPVNSHPTTSPVAVEALVRAALAEAMSERISLPALQRCVQMALADARARRAAFEHRAADWAWGRIVGGDVLLYADELDRIEAVRPFDLREAASRLSAARRVVVLPADWKPFSPARKALPAESAKALIGARVWESSLRPAAPESAMARDGVSLRSWQVHTDWAVVRMTGPAGDGGSWGDWSLPRLDDFITSRGLRSRTSGLAHWIEGPPNLLPQMFELQLIRARVLAEAHPAASPRDLELEAVTPLEAEVVQRLVRAAIRDVSIMPPTAP